MIAFLRFFIPLLIVQTIAYVVFSLRARARERDRLEAKWREEGQPGNLEAFVEAGLEGYEKSLRHKLLLAIYVVPWVALVAIVQWVNR
ncbi:hypothetical protein [Jhaorihella thermophila]|uniref:Uncharacterized protein n=1 Tax=Jhaorihella thermophila TaxID=488547 RepID=A0A1H5W9W7_9RHOB|nr:hypothetical protein [Jhaorihella thermophila]SEF96180.1 hypothetical protein SAMN05421751_107184 [Jhaorihella thermophila]